jgi:hypothetical protein
MKKEVKKERRKGSSEAREREQFRLKSADD